MPYPFPGGMQTRRLLHLYLSRWTMRCSVAVAIIFLPYAPVYPEPGQMPHTLSQNRDLVGFESNAAVDREHPAPAASAKGGVLH